MNTFKVQSCAGVRSGYWMDYMNNRQSKRPARRQARHKLNGKEFRKILEEVQKKA